MKIFAIVLYPRAQNQPVISAATHSLIGMESHEKLIRKKYQSIENYVATRQGVHTLKTDGGIYYAISTPDKTIYIAVDTELNLHSQLTLFDKVLRAKNKKDLENLIENPMAAVLSRADVILQDVEEAKKIVMNDIDKIIARGEKIENLVQSTEMLSQQTLKFKTAAIALREKSECPSLFTLFMKAKNFITGTGHYVYEYCPWKKKI